MSKNIYFRYDIFCNKSINLEDVTINIGKYNSCDFIISGNPSNIEDIVFKTIFINMDKMYKLIFDNCEITPDTYHANTHGIINMNKQEITKMPAYNDKIVSFCSYNNKPMYSQGAIENAIQYKKKYPEISVYMYTRPDVLPDIVSILNDNDVKIIHTIFIMDWTMMFARFYPVENINNTFFISRDTDCRPSDREDAAIDQLIKSGKSLHIIRDHPYHTVEILGGLWGVYRNKITNIRFMIMNWCMKYIKSIKKAGPDQHFLREVYNLNIFHNNKFVNDEFHKFENNRTRVNHVRKNKEYLGEAYNEMNDVADMNLRKRI